MQSHQLPKLNKKAKRIGRGGKRGSFSGRGIKGQKARAGRRIRPQIRDIIKKIHKRRGYGRSRASAVNPSKIKPAIVNLRDLERKFNNGEKVTPQSLIERGLVQTGSGKIPKIKILGVGKLTKKLVFDKNILTSQSARAKSNVE